MEKKNEKYTPEFEQVLDYCEKHCLFLGEGNPNGKILIVGKECAIKGFDFNDKEKAVAENNIKSWKQIIENAFCIDTITEELKKKELNITNDYYPLFPHLGQKCLQRRKEIIGKGGTSPTWYFYQKLVDKIIGNPSKGKDNYIDFHTNCFHTELSQIPLSMSKQLPKDLEPLRKKSIENRRELFRQKFFRQFPIVILAVAHYPRDYSFDIQDVFDVECIKQVSGPDWLNVHYQKSGNPRILIHTRQLSMISYEYIDKIAKEYHNRR